MLTFLLSWYESIDFDVIQTCRTTSKFVSDEEWIQKRQTLANFFTEFANVHTFIPDLPMYASAAAEAEEGVEGEKDDSEAKADEAEAEGERAEAGAASTSMAAETPASGSGGGAETETPAT